MGKIFGGPGGDSETLFEQLQQWCGCQRMLPAIARALIVTACCPRVQVYNLHIPIVVFRIAQGQVNCPPGKTGLLPED
jgi:hypothetical protein